MNEPGPGMTINDVVGERFFVGAVHELPLPGTASSAPTRQAMIEFANRIINGVDPQAIGQLMQAYRTWV
jgi:hypothetical protein